MTNVAVGQFTSGAAKDVNLKAIDMLVAQAADAGARVIVLPEFGMFMKSAVDASFLKSAETLDGPFVTHLGTLAVRYGLTVVCGMHEARPGGERISNTIVALGEDGHLSSVYRKLHLFDASGHNESQFVQAGDIVEPELFDVDGIRFGIQSCYDIRFPEVTRRIVDAGAEVLLVPASWVPGPRKEHHWETLVRARAIENTMYVAASGQTGPYGVGNSMIVDPMGVIIAGMGEEPGVAIGPISGDRVHRVRASNPALLLRRFAVSAIDTQTSTCGGRDLTPALP